MWIQFILFQVENITPLKRSAPFDIWTNSMKILSVPGGWVIVNGTETVKSWAL